MIREQLVECVPNFSEGRDGCVIAGITEAIDSVQGVNLLHVDSGAGVNRTVVTFVGTPEAASEAAFRAIAKAADLIDMRTHRGSHPRMGATDVCPLVPMHGFTVDQCVELSRVLAERVGKDLGIPVYLYEHSAQVPERKNLAEVRSGGYEGLEAKLKDPAWKPDFGPAKFDAKTGATAIGVRDFLIAFNINLNTRELDYARDIAFDLRTKGRSARRGNIYPIYLHGEEILHYEDGHYPCGEDDYAGPSIQQTAEHCRTEHGYDLLSLLKLNGINPEKPEGQSVKIPGRFSHCKAMGWFVPEYDRTQISINLTDYKVTSMHDVFEETCRLAAARGLVVTGSEIVGMVPYQALLESGIYYQKLQQRTAEISVRDVLSIAVESLRLLDVADFDVEKRVLGLPRDFDLAAFGP